MARPVTTLVIFFLCFNLFAGLLGSMGVDAMLGIDSEVGGDENVDELEGSTEDVPTGTGQGDTLFGMYNVLAGFVGGLYEFLMPGLTMMERVGVPEEITKMLGTLFGTMTAIAIAAYVRGYDL